MTAPTGGGFDGLSGAGSEAPAGSSPVPTAGPPAGIRTVAAGSSPTTTRLVLIRHGEAVCNVSGVCGGIKGCAGLTPRGVGQVEALRDRLLATGELAGADALYASVLPRAIETAALVAPALAGPRSGAGPGYGGPRPPLAVRTDCGLCELHPGEADGLTWEEFAERFADPDWSVEPDRPIAPGGESWTGFVVRVARTLEAITAAHPGQLVVVACHAGVIEASLLAMLPVARGRQGARLQLRTRHASLTTWEVDRSRWRLLGYNDAGPAPVAPSGSGEATPARGASFQQA